MDSSTIAAPQIDIGMAEVEHRSSGDTLLGPLGRQLHTVSQSYLKIMHVPGKAPASAIPLESSRLLALSRLHAGQTVFNFSVTPRARYLLPAGRRRRK